MEKKDTTPASPCELCLEYVSGACNEEESLAFELHLPHCDACQKELLELRTAWEALPVDIEWIEPPQDLKQQVMNAALAARPEDILPDSAGSHVAQWRPRKPRARLVKFKLLPGLLAASIAGIVLLSAWNIQLRHEQRIAPLPVEQALHVSAAQISELVSLKAQGPLAGKSSGVACIVDNGQSRQFVVYLFGAAATKGAEAYQVWLVKDGVRTSAGTFRVGQADRGIGLLAMPIASAKLDYDSIGITIEPDDEGNQPRGTKVFGSI
ncbi:anti-sigma factor [Paenibacillus sp. CF384]|uniref:anti-sigma factor n=1 Tax=Paenibacillus sp. CF384 TaxID=1884382 RepID=UPI00089C07F4|nr:anti-sigma factor [Paenibacillus sp. CF384]SDW94353.1 Anti-sigma-K factor rskA [Paenibacillus sp. CF384]